MRTVVFKKSHIRAFNEILKDWKCGDFILYDRLRDAIAVLKPGDTVDSLSFRIKQGELTDSVIEKLLMVPQPEKVLIMLILQVLLSRNPNLVIQLKKFIHRYFSSAQSDESGQYWSIGLSLIHEANCTSLLPAALYNMFDERVWGTSYRQASQFILQGDSVEDYDYFFRYLGTSVIKHRKVLMHLSVDHMITTISNIKKARDSFARDSVVFEYKLYISKLLKVATKAGYGEGELVSQYFFMVCIEQELLQEILYDDDAIMLNIELLRIAIAEVHVASKHKGPRVSTRVFNMLSAIIETLLSKDVSDNQKGYIGVMKIIASLDTELGLIEDLKVILRESRYKKISNDEAWKIGEKHQWAIKYIEFLHGEEVANTEKAKPKAKPKRSSKAKKKKEESVVEVVEMVERVVLAEPGPSRIDEEKEKTKTFLEFVSALCGKDIAVLDPESGSAMYRLRCKNKEEASTVKRLLTNVFGTEIETEIIKGKEHIINLIKIPEVTAESKVKAEEALKEKEEIKEGRKEEVIMTEIVRHDGIEEAESREELKAIVEEEGLLSELRRYDAALRGAGVQIDYGKSNAGRILFYVEQDNKNIKILKNILESAGYKTEWENRRNASKEQALRISEFGSQESLLEELRKLGEKSTSKTEFRGRGKEPEEKAKEVEIVETKHTQTNKDAVTSKLLGIIEDFKSAHRIMNVGALAQGVVEYLEVLSSDPEVKKRRNALVHQGYISQENIGEWIKYAEAAVENPQIFVPVALLQLQRNRSRVEKDVASIIEERFTFEGTNQMEDRLWKLSRLLELVKDIGLRGEQYSELKAVRNMAMHPEGVDRAELRERVNAFILCCKSQDRDIPRGLA